MRRGLGRDAVKQRLQAVGALANRLLIAIFYCGAPHPPPSPEGSAVTA
jgi:hypothetical protein